MVALCGRGLDTRDLRVYDVTYDIINDMVYVMTHAMTQNVISFCQQCHAEANWAIN